jgi:hypothetical protein
MPAPREPHPPHDRDRRPSDLSQVLVDRWARLASRRPWSYAATWALGIGAANLVLRMLLNDLPLAQNARLAALVAGGFFVFAWLYTAQLTRPLRRRGATFYPAVLATSGATVGRCRPGRRSPTGRGPRSGALWACPQRAAARAEGTGRPAARTATWPRRLLLAAIAVAVVTVAVLVATAHAQAHTQAGGWALGCLDHQTLAPGIQAPGRS